MKTKTEYRAHWNWKVAALAALVATVVTGYANCETVTEAKPYSEAVSTDRVQEPYRAQSEALMATAEQPEEQHEYALYGATVVSVNGETVDAERDDGNVYRFTARGTYEVGEAVVLTIDEHNVGTPLDDEVVNVER